MIGAIAGDIIGSIYERHNIHRTDFPLFGEGCRFTDDTVLTVATADAILGGGDYAAAYREYYRRYPERGYGPRFRKWAASDRQGPYGSLGNGSAMRVGPIGWAFETLEEVLDEARKSAEVTHDHPEGIKGAQAVAAALFLARTGSSKDEISEYVSTTFGYRLDRSLERIREDFQPDVTCPGSVPQAITAFLLSDGVEDTIRNAVSLGGDSDTVACIAGGIAEAYYGGVSADIEERVFEFLDDRLSHVIKAFAERFQS
jgi:ADP-ribosylglycohydrolase